jgi:predicted cupin superfamily sugar epimerase
MHRNARLLIENLRLRPHPEGGWYRETYRSERTIPGTALPAGYAGSRSLGTAILYLLADGAVSGLHRLRGDELWLHHAGGGLDLHLFRPPASPSRSGRYERRRLGPAGADGTAFQVVVPGGCWFGATLVDPDGFAVVGCTMAPGFDPADFELPSGTELGSVFPEHTELLARLSGRA